MTSNFQHKLNFLFSCFVSLTGLFAYLFGQKKLHFPEKIFLNGSNFQSDLSFFYFTQNHFYFRYATNLFFSFLSLFNKNFVAKTKGLQNFFKSILSSIYVFISAFLYYNRAEISVFDKICLSLLSVVINCCFFEAFIEIINKYGICDTFSLIFFSDLIFPFLYHNNFKESYLEIFKLFLFTIFFILIVNLKWEAPIKNNQNFSSAGKNNDFTLSFNFNHDVSSLVALDYFFSGFIFFVILILNSLSINLSTKVYLREKLAYFLFFLSEQKQLLFFNQNFFLSFFLIYCFFRFPFYWLQIYFDRLKPSKISEELQQSGIYFDGLEFGNKTELFISWIVNNMIFLSFFNILLLNLIFDNFIWLDKLKFFTWINFINTGVNLFKEIKMKYEYEKINKEKKNFFQ